MNEGFTNGHLLSASRGGLLQNGWKWNSWQESQNVRNFVWKNIICHFGIPRVLISDNGCQFDNASFRDFCE